MTVDDHIQEPAEEVFKLGVFNQPYLHARETEICDDLQYVGHISGVGYKITIDGALKDAMNELEDAARKQEITHVFGLQQSHSSLQVTTPGGWPSPKSWFSVILTGDGYKSK